MQNKHTGYRVSEMALLFVMSENIKNGHHLFHNVPLYASVKHDPTRTALLEFNVGYVLLDLIPEGGPYSVFNGEEFFKFFEQYVPDIQIILLQLERAVSEKDFTALDLINDFTLHFDVSELRIPYEGVTLISKGDVNVEYEMPVHQHVDFTANFELEAQSLTAGLKSHTTSMDI